MIEDSGKKLLRYLIIHKLDRFSRDKYDAVTYKRKLKMNGVTILSVTENLDDSPESAMLESCLEGMAQYFSRNLAREVMKGMRESAYKCTHLGGIPPLGYEVEAATKKYVVNETEAGIVRTIFSKYAEGVGYNQILEYLNGMGYRSKRGQPFGKNSLNSILKNEKYVGKFIFNKKLEKDVSGKRNPMVKPEEEWIVVPGGLPAIVDEDIFDKVQAKMAQNKKNSGMFKAKEIYLLSGLVECGECGSSMYGNTRMCGRNKSNYSSYRCSGRANHRGCTNKEVRRDYIDNYVLDELYRRLFSDISIRKLASMLNDYNRKQSAASSGEVTQAQGELEEVTRKISTVIQLVTESGISIETVKEELRKLEERKRFIEGYIQELGVKNKVSLISEEAVLGLLNRSRDFIKTHNISECRNFINSYIEKVVVFKEKVEVFFKIHVPDETADKVVPLKSEEGIIKLRREYQSVPKGWSSPEKESEQLVGH
ncbi:MAG: recombinase family protein [Synergistaceae bacterium]|jgi:site-specific DNA recombinase|nr:recombinase family protein [Synergistaceae bacterium]